MATQWFYNDDGNEIGPLSAADMRRLAETGAIGRATLVKRAVDQEWFPAGSVAGLVSASPRRAGSTIPAIPPPLPASSRLPPVRAARAEGAGSLSPPVANTPGANSVHPIAWIAIGCGVMSVLVLIAAVNGFFAVPKADLVADASPPSKARQESDRRGPQFEQQAQLIAKSVEQPAVQSAVSSAAGLSDRVPPDGKVPRAVIRALWDGTRESLIGVNGRTHLAPKPSDGNLTAEALFARASPAVVWIEARNGLGQMFRGSGFIVSENGLIVTNHHVIAGAVSAFVHTTDGMVYPVEGLAADDSTADLALLKINADSLPKVELAGSKLPPVGARVYAIGSPGTKGLQLQFTNTLSDGLVSAHRDPVPGLMAVQTIQISAPISHGSSGGPLLAADGKVVGVVTFTFHDFGAENVNAAVPAIFVRRLIEHKGNVRALVTADSGRLSAQERISTGDSSYAMERYEDAAIAYETALRIDPKVDVQEKLGCACAMLRKYQLAIIEFKAAVAKVPSSERYRRLGVAYDGAGEMQSAITAFKQAVAMNRDDEMAHVALGWGYFRVAQYDAAEHEFKLVLANRNSTLYWQLDARFYLGECEWQKWEIGEAIKDWKRVCDLDPQHKVGTFAGDAKQVLDLIELEQSEGFSLQRIRADMPRKPK